jgi:DNA primase
MAEAGSFAEKVKQQADIVRVIGEYLRLRKTGQNFTGLCPFHQEKTPSFSVHPVKQMYYCFGCHEGGDVFKFVMQMDRCEFPEAVRTVAEKCGIPISRATERSPEERRQNQQRSALVEIHREAAAFLARQLHQSPEGKVAMAYLEDRGLDRDAMMRFGLGYAPGTGDALLRQLKSKYHEKVLDASGLFSRDQSGRMYDRFRRRIMFPIASDSGKIIAFGGRSMGDDMPKYLNSPETPIYSKSNVLYHLDRAKEAIRQHDFAILVEGYMDAIAVARSGITNVVASCGTSLAEAQIKLLGRFTRRIVVNYDADTAGQTATERSLAMLLEKEFDVRVLLLPGGADPDEFLKKNGADAYRKLLAEAPTYLDYLIARARRMDRTTAAGKLAALNYLMPYLQRVPSRIVRLEWAGRIKVQLGVNDYALAEAFKQAVTARRSEVRPRTDLTHVEAAERLLIGVLVEVDGFRDKVAAEIAEDALHKGLGTEKIFDSLLRRSGSPQPISVSDVLEELGEQERDLLLDISLVQFAHGAPQPSWDAVTSALDALREKAVSRRLTTELAELQKQIDSKLPFEEMKNLLARRQELQVLQRKLIGKLVGR